MSANDLDCGINARVSYAIDTSARLHQLTEFNLHNESGEICLKTALDYESKKVYEFQIIASDAGLYLGSIYSFAFSDKI